MTALQSRIVDHIAAGDEQAVCADLTDYLGGARPPEDRDPARAAGTFLTDRGWQFRTDVRGHALVLVAPDSSEHRAIWPAKSPLIPSSDPARKDRGPEA